MTHSFTQSEIESVFLNAVAAEVVNRKIRAVSVVLPDSFIVELDNGLQVKVALTEIIAHPELRKYKTFGELVKEGKA